MAAGYKPPPSVKTQLPDATIGDLPRIAAPATTPAPVAAPAPAAAPAAAPVAAPSSLTKQQQMIQMFKDAKAAMDAKEAAMDAELQKALAQPTTTPGPESTLTVKPPGGSGAPK